MIEGCPLASLVTARHTLEVDFTDKTSLNKMFKNLCSDLPVWLDCVVLTRAQPSLDAIAAVPSTVRCACFDDR